MRRLALRLGGALFLLLLALVAADREGDRIEDAGEATSSVILVSHGYHTGLILPRAALASHAAAKGRIGLLQVLNRFSPFEWLEIGWGAEDFYRNVARLEWASVPHAARALFVPGNKAVLHVVGFSVAPVDAFPASTLISVPVSEAGLARLLDALDTTISRDPSGFVQDLGPGLYGPSRFFAAEGNFSFLHVCNHWISELMIRAGLPANRTLAILPAGLFLDLAVRSGAKRLAVP